MLLHVYQGDEAKAQAFPQEVVEALAHVVEEGGAADPASPIPSSRRMELRSRS
jgi:hypothetical protein